MLTNAIKNLTVGITILILFSIYSKSNTGNFEIISHTKNSLIIKFTSGYSGDSLINTNDNLNFKLPKFSNINTVFNPNSLYPNFSSKTNIIVPDKDSYNLGVKSTSYKSFRNYNLAQNDNIINGYKTTESDVINSEKRLNDPVQANYLGISRNQHLAEIVVEPVNYNAKSKEIMIYDSIIIQISYDESKINYSKEINSFNSLLALNSDYTRNWGINKKDDIKSENFLGNENTIASLSNGQWARIVIEEEGVYRLDPSDLQSAGIPINAATAKTIKIFGEGGKPLSETVSDGAKNILDEQEIIVRTKPDGSIENVIFYAAASSGFENRNGQIRHYKNFYSDKNYYLITWGGVDGKRANPLPEPSGDVVNRPSTYTERVFFDEDVVNPYNPGAGRDWFGRSFFSSPLPLVMLHDLDRNGEVSYRLALAHRAESFGKFSVFENNNQITSINLFPINSNYVAAIRGFATVKIPASQIAADNRSIIKLQYQNQQISAVGYFDYYEMTYPRRFFAVNNSLGFIADNEISGITNFNINGFSGEIFGYDISDLKNPKLLTNNSSTGGIFSFNYLIEKNKSNRFYISSNLRKPKLETIEIVGLRDKLDNAPIVVITHPDLYQSALKFKEYRESSQNKKVEVYRTDHIYNEYSSTIPDITAIRDFLIDIYNRWDVKPEYLVLWGDGHYDYRNIGTKKVNYIPAYQTYNYDLDTFDEIYEGYATDDYLSLLVGDDLMVDINFGRLPIDNPDLGFWMVDKIKHYETASSEDIWRTNNILIADDGPSEDLKYDGNLFTNQTENLQENYISKNKPDFQFDKVYMAEYPVVNVGSGRRKPGVTEDLLTRVNTTGGLLMNWIGHGNPRVWAHEQILDRDITIPRMRNLDKLFFLTAATCDYGRFDNPEVRSGAEDMILSRVGGAIGVFSATRVVFASENARLSYAFYTKLLTRNPQTGKYPSLGEVVNAVKQSFTSTNDRKYLLLGDPTMTLLIPDYTIKLTSINDIPLGNSSANIELKALSKIVIRGEVYNPLSDKKEENYNGTIVVTLRDGDVSINFREFFNGQPRDFYNYNKYGGMLNRSSYSVQNGNFTAEFIIPKDISFSDSNSRLFLYSASDDGKYGSGSFHKTKITGFGDSNFNDTIPPEVLIYLDGRNFQSGDLVTKNPRLIVDLFDESGINTTGLGIGHKIEGWIDDSPQSVDLTDKFSSSLSDSRRGTVQDILFGLSSGEHKIKIRAWDVFNNFSISEVKFIIPDGNDGGLITNLYNYPNPFSTYTNLVFRHNTNPPFEANVEIYTINGVLIRNIKNTLNTLHTSQVYWDGLDNSGFVVPAGVYFYNVKLNHDYGTTVGRGKVVKLSN